VGLAIGAADPGGWRPGDRLPSMADFLVHGLRPRDRAAVDQAAVTCPGGQMKNPAGVSTLADGPHQGRGAQACQLFARKFLLPHSGAEDRQPRHALRCQKGPVQECPAPTITPGTGSWRSHKTSLRPARARPAGTEQPEPSGTTFRQKEYVIPPGQGRM